MAKNIGPSLLVIMAIEGMILTGCQAGSEEGDDSSDTKSLSQLEQTAGGQALLKETCSGTNQVNGGIAVPASQIRGVQSAAVKQALDGALAAVPSSVTFAFFQYDGFIQITDDTATACAGTGAVNLAGGEQPDGCLKLEPGKVLAAYFRPDPAAIRAALTRVFGLYYSYGGSRAVMAEGELSLADPDEASQSLWAALKKQVVAELAAKPGMDTASAGFKQVAALEPEQVYPEAFDSYFCSSETRQRDTQKFPETMGTFAVHAKGLEALDQAVMQALQTRNTSSFDSLQGAPSTARFATVVRAMVDANLDGDKESGAAGFGLAKRPLAGFTPGQPLRNVGRGAFNVGRRGANLFRRH